MLDTKTERSQGANDTVLLSIPRAPTSRPRPSPSLPQRVDTSSKSPPRVQRGSSISPVYAASSPNCARVGSPVTRPPPTSAISQGLDTQTRSISPPRMQLPVDDVVLPHACHEDVVVPAGRQRVDAHAISPLASFHAARSALVTSPPRRRITTPDAHDEVDGRPPSWRISPSGPQIATDADNADGALLSSPLPFAPPRNHNHLGSPLDAVTNQAGSADVGIFPNPLPFQGDREREAPAHHPQPAVTLVGWSEAAEVSSHDEDTELLQAKCAPHPIEAMDAPYRRTSSPHPVFVVPSRSSSADSSRRSTSVTHHQHDPPTTRWEEVRTPAGRNGSRLRSHTPPHHPQRYSPLVRSGDDDAPVQFDEISHHHHASTFLVGHHHYAEVVEAHRETHYGQPPQRSLSVDALAVGGHGAAIHKMSPALASYATTAAAPIGRSQSASPMDGVGASSFALDGRPVQKYTTEDLFPTRVRASLARSQSPPAPTAVPLELTARQHATQQLRSALQPNLSNNALVRPVIESGAVWGDANSTTAPMFTPRDSLNSSAFVASLDNIKLQQQAQRKYIPQTSTNNFEVDESSDSMHTRIAKSVHSSINGGHPPSGHVSFSSDTKGVGAAADGDARSPVDAGRPPIAHPQAPASRPTAAAVTLQQHHQHHSAFDTSAAFDVEVVEEVTAPVNATAAPPPATTDEGDDVFMDVRCCDDNANTAQEQKQHGQQRAREASPAFSTASFLTVVSGRAASAREMSNDMLHRATSPEKELPVPTAAPLATPMASDGRAFDDRIINWNHERIGPANTLASDQQQQQRQRSLSAAMESIVPAAGASNDVPAARKAPAPFALAAPREPSPSFHEFINVFGRSSEERDLMLLEAQRQRVAAEAAVIELQIKSVEREYGAARGASPLAAVSVPAAPLLAPNAVFSPGAPSWKSAASTTAAALHASPHARQPSATSASSWQTQLRNLTTQPRPNTTPPSAPVITSPLPVAPPPPPTLTTRSASRVNTLQELFALAANSITRPGGSERAPSSTVPSGLEGDSAQQPTRLEQLAASASPTPNAPVAARSSSPFDSMSIAYEAAFGPHATSSAAYGPKQITATTSSSSSGGHTARSSPRNWSVSSPSANGSPTSASAFNYTTAATLSSPSMPTFSPMVYRSCSALRPLTRSLLSSLIRLDTSSKGSVALSDCVKAIQVSLQKAGASTVDTSHAMAFLEEILPRVHRQQRRRRRAARDGPSAWQQSQRS